MNLSNIMPAEKKDIKIKKKISNTGEQSFTSLRTDYCQDTNSFFIEQACTLKWTISLKKMLLTH